MQKTASDRAFPAPLPPRRGGLFLPAAAPLDTVFPIQSVHIDWDRLIAKRPLTLKTVDAMPVYLLKPEVLALTPSSFVEDGYGYGVILTTLKQRPGHPKKIALARSVKRYVPIADLLLQDRI